MTFRTIHSTRVELYNSLTVILATVGLVSAAGPPAGKNLPSSRTATGVREAGENPARPSSLQRTARVVSDTVVTSAGVLPASTCRLQISRGTAAERHILTSAVVVG